MSLNNFCDCGARIVKSNKNNKKCINGHKVPKNRKHPKGNYNAKILGGLERNDCYWDGENLYNGQNIIHEDIILSVKKK